MVVRKIPTLAKLSPPTQNAPAISWREKFRFHLREIKYSTYRPLILSWLEKVLRKLRLLILKTDNLFINWIKFARSKSEVWTIRSRAWMEHRRLKKKAKAQVLEKLDKVELSQTLEKIKLEAAAEEDEALKEKIKNLNGDGIGRAVLPQTTNEDKKEFLPVYGVKSAPETAQAVQTPEIAPAEPEEKKYIDLIAQNPKDTAAYRALGFIYLKQKNYSDARACFRQVLKIEPDDTGIKIKLDEIKGLKNKKPR
ncbi:MAG: Uncharacterized protein LiPW39_231 [Parcubacteria group bacterium LiPW_39]|nr:MAG: Uncharacterized protein LiPW39_231 [Parcubacteria group bacterium LiPW_39]